jgi:NAD(P)-dependent dehydrogenase (short-subunit alcohol dehydrogenase family)
VPYGSTSDWVKNVHAAGGIGAYRASEQASRMLTWALADRLRGTPVTVNAFNPGYVVTDLTRRVGGLLKAVVGLTRFRAHTPLDGADTAIWLAASPDVDGITGTFWNKRREIRCRFRDAAAIEHLWTVVEQQTAATLRAGR